MDFPKVKHALLCRILIYLVVIGAFLFPGFLLCAFNTPEVICLLTFFAGGIGLIIYIFRNFGVLMVMDMLFAYIRCILTARKQYDLLKNDRIEKRISRFGHSCTPTQIHPIPSILRYKLSHPISTYTSGIEKVIAVYHVDFLNKDSYRSVYTSARTNSKSLTGFKKPLFLDKQQKKSRLNRVTVAVIFANSIDEPFRTDLYDVVCKQPGDDFEYSILPCIIDLQKGICVFNSVRIPYTGFCYAVKNRGIRIIRKYVFGGKMPLTNNHHLIDSKLTSELDLNQSLWKLWHNLIKEFVTDEKDEKKRYGRMTHKQVILENDFIYIKWENQGVCTTIDFEESPKEAIVYPVTTWSYPKKWPIAKKTRTQIHKIITDFLLEKGYKFSFRDTDDE